MRKVSPLTEAAVFWAFALLSLLGVGLWLNNARPLRTATDSTLACADNLHQLSSAVSQYTQDNDEFLPPMRDAPTFQAAVLPYASSPKAFNCPDTGLPYTPNAAISQKSFASVYDDSDTIEVARDAQPHEDGLYTVLFLDNMVQHGGQEVGDPNSIVLDRARRLGLAVIEYEQDNDYYLPPMHTPEEFQAAIYPYTHSRRVFYSPNGLPFVPNAALSGVAFFTITDPATTVLFHDTEPYVGGFPTIAYVDGHATHTFPSFTHVLWANTDGTMSLWDYSLDIGTYTSRNYGFSEGWSAKSLANGAEGKTAVLWTTAAGQASLWGLDTATGTYAHREFGPYPGWAAVAVSAGLNTPPHVLWTNTNGAASIWNYDTGTGRYTQHTYGPYSGWTAIAIADDPDGKMQVLWRRVDGMVSLWNLDNGAGTYTYRNFGPYPGWSAKALSVGQDNTAHVLWTNTNGAASLWDYSAPTGSYTYKNYGPFGGWSAKAVADGADGKTSVLWTTSAGQASVWSLDSTTSVYTNHEFGPFTGWSAIGISAGP